MLSLKQKALFIIITAALLINAVLLLEKKSTIWILKEVLIDKNKSRLYLATGMDSLLDKAVPHGNLFIKFNGFPVLNNDLDTDLPLIIYMRSVFHLYPRRVFTVPDNVAVTKGNAILKADFKPDIKWLQSHGVTKVITITKTPNSNIYTKVETVPPSMKKDKK